jgi:hypothetical protein
MTTDEYSMESMAVAKAFAAGLNRLVRQSNGDGLLLPELLSSFPRRLPIVAGDTHLLAAVMPNASDTELAEGQLHVAGLC